MLSKYILLFTLCSVVGWIYESLYAAIKTKSWEARGFLYGPLCPIYGFGVCGIVLLAKAFLIYTNATYSWYQIAIVAFFGSMILEYVTSWALEQLFHAYWWDYSDMPLNINGRTCIPAAILFALGGLGAVYVISPWWDSVTANIPALAMDIMAYAVVYIIAMDVTLTVSSLTAIQENVALAASVFHAHADQITNTIVDKSEDMASKISAEKDRISEEVLQYLFDGLTVSARMALSRVEGFKPPVNISAPPDVPAFTKKLLERVKGLKK